MNPYSRAIFALLAAFIAWTIVRAWRKGRIVSDFVAYDASRNPILFSGTFVVRVGIFFFFVALSAGYSMDEISRFFGLSELTR